MVWKSVPEGIASFADREGVEVIVMYTHDRKGLAKLIKGSIAEKVQRRAPIEVKVFRPQEL
jgi:nucleotide-binding universal stress UspA family protein